MQTDEEESKVVHDLKCWPEYFQAVKSGIKPFELRKDDRGYAVGDVLHLREYDPATIAYTGDTIDKMVTYVLPTKLFGALGEGAGYVIMGLASADNWTPCSERLPTNSANYKVTVQVGSEVGSWREAMIIPYRFYDGSGEWILPKSDWKIYGVIAWTKADEPWKGKTDGE